MRIRLPDIPPRTSIATRVPVDEIDITTADVIAADRYGVTYTCIDCGFTTSDHHAMCDHQVNQQKYHTLWQRFCRFFSFAC